MTKLNVAKCQAHLFQSKLCFLQMLKNVSNITFEFEKDTGALFRNLEERRCDFKEHQTTTLAKDGNEQEP